MSDEARKPAGRPDGRDELNLCEFPIAFLGERAPAGVSSLEFEDAVHDRRTGAEVRRRLVISAPERYGLPNATDEEVLLGLIQLTRSRNDFREAAVQFSRYELIGLLGWPHKGASYKRLGLSLTRWTAVYLDYQRAWWCNARKTFVDEKFHVLERVSLCEREGRGGGPALPLSTFVWSGVMLRSFEAGYLKRLDLDFYLSLRNLTARRLYRYLDKHFYHSDRLQYDLAEFALEHVGLSRGSCGRGGGCVHVGKVKEKLAPAIAELEVRGFLAPSASRYAKAGRGKWRVSFEAARGVAAAGAAAAEPAATAPPPPEGTAELVARGVAAAAAAALAAEFGAERVGRQARAFDWLLERGRLSVNPPGYLVASIRGDYAPPEGFAEQGRRQEREGRKRAEGAAGAGRLARAQEERERVEAHIRGLTAAERARLEEEAVNATAETRASYEQVAAGGRLVEAYRQALLRTHVRRVLGLGECDGG